MADTTSTLSPPPFREALSPPQGPLRQPLLLTDTWQRWMTLWWQQHTALWKQGQGGTWQPIDPTLSALAALTGTADTFPYFDGADHMALTGLSAYSRSLLTQATAGTWRSTLGLGTLSTLNSPLAVADGGTGATTAGQARTNLGLGTLSTANAPLTVAQGGTGATDAATARTNLGLGTMAVQNATAVAVTGGTVTGLSTLSVAGTSALNRTGIAYAAPSTVWLRSGALSADNVLVGYGDVTPGYGLQVAGTAYFGSTVHVASGVGIKRAPASNVGVYLDYLKGSEFPIVLHPTDSDANTAAILFQNVAGGTAGTITTTASATAYNTSSDRRLKMSIATLTGALARVQALRPVSFRWRVDHRPGVGFVADELQTHISDAVTGEPDAVDAQGNVVPQGVDLSKLMPWAIAGMQELLVKCEALEARLLAIEGGKA